MRSGSIVLCAALTCALCLLAACSPGGLQGDAGSQDTSAPASVTNERAGAAPASGGVYRRPGTGASDAGASSPATRTTPIVPGRPARVFIFAGVDEACQPLPEPQLTVAKSPAKGEISFRPGQATTIAASGGGTCIGAKATGTGVYYTARASTAGADSFSVTAKLAGGETMTRDFRVEIAE